MNQSFPMDLARKSKKFDSARQSCQGDKECGVSLVGNVDSKQYKIVPNHEGEMGSPTDSIASRAKKTYEKVY